MKHGERITAPTVRLKARINEFFSAPAMTDLQETTMIRLEVEAEHYDLLEWLHCQKENVKTYWRDRQDGFEMAGIGVADLVESEYKVESKTLFKRLSRYLHDAPETLRYYGGIRFGNQTDIDKHWRDFGMFRFVVPQFEMVVDKTARFACNFLFDPRNPKAQKRSLLEALSDISFDLRELPVRNSLLLKRRDYPDKQGWISNIKGALSMFRNKQLRKIVLARKSTFDFARRLNPIEILQQMQATGQNSFQFYIQPRKWVAFIGSSPERLFSRSHRKLASEAMAGTRRRGSTPAEDQQLEHNLLESNKDAHEHRLVLESLRRSFGNLCTSVDEHDKVSVRKLGTLQHLFAAIQGILGRDVDNGQILDRLHPTPAVGGSPRREAMRHIAELEPFDRGWYAGPVGWVSKNAAEFCVAIRSAQVVRNRLNVYAGAGIVPGSEPEKEWDEIENKIAAFLNAIHRISGLEKRGFWRRNVKKQSARLMT